ncbi:carbon-nitrogen hydrolase [Diplogelasinospora grovesii]|uniref:Carbon-nitrogen hydrolase n=1 Tax=Diplogelasinospora grovesii TaxID=303347 RepID=A0AAN6NHT3_9PEZI|nr:carbon-nitrogen hydrolase [Diplogelasinospora grovesii]
MRIGCLQFAPQVGDVENNLNRADAVLAKADSMALDSLDLLVLPEMAFSGYNFKSLQEIMPYLEPSGSGISALWARTTALKYDCTVAVGYPEKVNMSHRRSQAGPEYYNSLIVVNGDGETVANYRKSFLYYTDETWALEGDGFYAGEVGQFGKVAMGICMDINPYKFEAPWHKFEFAFHILEVKANLVILSMAWLTREDSSTFTPLTHEPDMETMTYWVQRLEPLIRAENEEEVIVVFCNRCGIEDDVVYAGTSAVIGIKGGEVSVYGLLGRGVKELLLIDTDMPPFAKLINRPDNTPGEEEAADYETVSSQAEQQSDMQSSSTPLTEATSVFPDAPSSPYTRRDERTYTETQWDNSAEDTRGRTRVRPGSNQPSPSWSKQSHALPEGDEYDDAEESDEHEAYDGCNGNCGGCAEHAEGEKSADLDTPTCPSPTPWTQRPKLALSTGPETIPQLQSEILPAGMEPGNFFTSRDLCTPPETPFDDVPMSAAAYYSRNPPPWAAPPSAVMYTPDEPIWPVFEGSTKIDFKRTPSRTDMMKPASRMQEIKASEVQASNACGTAEVALPSRPRLPRSGFSDPAQQRRRSRSVGESNLRHEPSDQSRSHHDDARMENACQPRTIEVEQSAKNSRLSALLQSIPIAASPSVFQTTFPRDHIDRPQTSLSRSQTEPSMESVLQQSTYRKGHRARSKSTSGTIPLHQYQPPAMSQTSQTPTISSRGVSRGRHGKKVYHDYDVDPAAYYTGIQSVVSPDEEASFGQTALKAQSRGRHRATRRHATDLLSPVSI